MTPDEIAEAEQLLANGTLHARMLPLLRAAVEHITSNAHAVELQQRLELTQLLAEIGVQADIPQQEELFRFVKAGFASTPQS